MSLHGNKPNKVLLVIALCLAVTAIIFVELWLSEKQRKQREVTKEILKEVEKIKVTTNQVTVNVPVDRPVEVVKEVEVVKTVVVPAQLTPKEVWYISTGSNFLSASLVSHQDDTLRGANSVLVAVDLGLVAKEFISENRIKDKVELIFRRNGLPVSTEGINSIILGFSINAMWIEEVSNQKSRLAYHMNLVASRNSVFETSTGFIRRYLDVWRDGSYGTVGRQKAAEGWLGIVEEQAEAFANAFLKANR